MVEVSRVERAAAPADVDALIGRLQECPGLWMGCDVEAEGLYRRGSMACAVPALRFCLDGATLTVTPMTGTGAGLLPVLLDDAGSGTGTGERLIAMPTGSAVVELLRTVLSRLRPASPELALFGAFSFDYHLLGEAAPLPDDGRRRLVAYLPECVLSASGNDVRWIDFSFGVEPVEHPSPLVPPVHIDPADDPPPGTHAARVARGIEFLRRGELYSLVLSQTFRRRAVASCADAFRALRNRNPYPAMFFCNLGGGERLFGASPDLQVRADSTSVESAPVCGTLRRGEDAIEDAAQALALLASRKEAAALALCADSAAAELAGACEPGSLELVSYRRVHFFSTIIHSIAHLRGRRRAGVDGFQLLLRHALPATVTGLPKREAVSAIAALEEEWRGWYAGAVARIGSDGSVDAYTILRAARVAGSVSEIRTGGNILVDSDPAGEETESRLKAQTLFRVLAGDLAEPPRALPDHRVRAVVGDDPFRDRTLDALARAGATVDPHGVVVVVSGPMEEGGLPVAPIVATASGAIWLLRREGASPEPFASPRYGREASGHGCPGTFLEGLGAFVAGWYGAYGIRVGRLPSGWKEAAVSGDGWVLAAECRDRPACAILWQPDSILSLRGSCGARALRAALARLDPYGMFDRQSKQEER